MATSRGFRHGDAFRAARPGRSSRRPYVVVEEFGDEITYREIWQLPAGTGCWEAGILRMNAVTDFVALETLKPPPKYRLAKAARPNHKRPKPPSGNGEAT